MWDGGQEGGEVVVLDIALAGTAQRLSSGPGTHAYIRVAERLGERLLNRIEWLGNEYLVYGIKRGLPANRLSGGHRSATDAGTAAITNLAGRRTGRRGGQPLRRNPVPLEPGDDALGARPR